jgi:hypothetical protein
MLTRTISTTVTTSVVLDTGHYANVLTITASGEVAPAAGGADAISAPSSATDDRVTNYGIVLGGLGANEAFAAYAGGAGVDLAGGGVRNHGVITGGAGGVGGYFGGYGGAGITLGGAGGVNNTGTITGGAGGNGGSSYGGGGNGGAGVALTDGGSLVNRGDITGGAGGSGSYPSNGGAGVYLAGSGTVSNFGTITGGDNFRAQLYGGVGVSLGGGTLVNKGLIEGGLGADGVQIGQGGSLMNAGTIEGNGAGLGVAFQSSGTATNFGQIEGGAGGGGYGILFRGEATLGNYGTITGGSAGADADSGGIALDLETYGTVTNAGTIEGGAGGLAGNGGFAVELQYGSTLTNRGMIVGGGSVENAGATGIYLLRNSSVTNRGVISGGSGNYGGYGVRLSYGSDSLVNAGTIEGGTGGTAGGVGVFIDGATVTSSGTIAGGIGANGVRAEAVQFGFYGGTLVVDPSAVFEGGIQGSNYYPTTVELAGHSQSTLSGIGTSVVGITNFVEDASARWTLSGSLSGTGAVSIGTDARLTLDGASSIATIAFGAGGDGTLGLETPALVSSVLAGFSIGDKIELAGIQASSFTLSQDTLTLFNAKHAVVDTLQFSGSLSAADIALVTEGRTTDIVYGGSGPSTLPEEWLHTGLVHGLKI